MKFTDSFHSSLTPADLKVIREVYESFLMVDSQTFSKRIDSALATLKKTSMTWRSLVDRYLKSAVSSEKADQYVSIDMLFDVFPSHILVYWMALTMFITDMVNIVIAFMLYDDPRRPRLVKGPPLH